MKNLETLHIFFIPRQDKEAFWRANQKLEHHRNLVVITHQRQLPVLLSKLDPQENVILWLHIGTFQTDASGYPMNLSFVQELREAGIISDRAVINFFTTGGLDINIKGDINAAKNPYMKVTNGHPVYTLKVLGKNPEKQQFQPKPQTIKEITTPAPRAIKHLNYDESDHDPHLLFRIKGKVSDQEIKEILGACFPPSAKNFFLKPISGGYSGAHVFRVDYEVDGLEVTSLLKIDQQATDLISEYQFGHLKQLKNLGSAFVHPFPTQIKKVNNWHCLIFPFMEHTVTLRRFLQHGYLDQFETALSTLEKALNIFIEFERKISIPSFRKAKPWSGTYTDDYHYQGLQLKMSHKVNLLHTIAKAVTNIPSHILDKCKINRSDLNALINFIKAENEFSFKNQPIDTIGHSQYQKVPLAIVHRDLHLGNILIDDQEMISFIDFANVDPRAEQHAFLDIGKMSADLEISVLELELNDWDKIAEALHAHQAWMNGDSHTSEQPAIHYLYMMNTFLRKNLLTKFQEHMNEKEVLYQFHLVRLHYFLKAISYNNLKREKTLFLISLCIDILNTLTQKQA